MTPQQKDKEERTTSPIAPTDMIHMSYEGNFLLECDSIVVDVVRRTTDTNDNHTDNVVLVDLVLDRTTMHPQGGGQPSDVGIISTEGSAMNVTKVTIDRESGIFTHSGVVTSGNNILVEVGQGVHVAVNSTTRTILSECHTAGHVVDSAMARCNKILPAIKAYHFLDGPYVEYRGNIPLEERDGLVKDLQKAFLELVEEDIATKIQSMSRRDAEYICNRDSVDLSEFSEQDEIRIVTVAGWSCPCGGTHVRSTSDLKERKWNVSGIKSKKGVVRVKYGQNVQ